MGIPQDQVFESALSLPQPARADLAFQLLQTLGPPGDEITADEFGAELLRRIESYRRGELASFGIDETRAIIQKRLSLER